VILTGAGISAESGLGTFRDEGGLWTRYDLADVATPEGFARDPALVHGFYNARRANCLDARPNAAHAALARLEAALPAGRIALVTQNIDDLHERAGSTPLHMHGELAVLRCEVCGARVRDRESLDPERFVPCARCGHPRLRPGVVWFGELPHEVPRIERALARCTHFLAVGTSGQVYPAAGFLAAARAVGARTIVTGLDEPENLARADRFLPGRAAEVVPSLVDELLAEMLG